MHPVQRRQLTGTTEQLTDIMLTAESAYASFIRQDEKRKLGIVKVNTVRRAVNT